MPPAENPYRLSEAANDRIYREQIERDLPTDVTPQEHPVVVFLIAQSGAGKTLVGYQIGEALNQHGGFLTINTDLYRPYSPWYDRLFTAADPAMFEYTRDDAQRWRNKMTDHVKKYRKNALVHVSGNNPESLVDTMCDFRAADFRVEAAVLAVHFAVSQQGVYARYHQQVLDLGGGRLSPWEYALAAYKAIPVAADLIDERRAAAAVAVFRRGDATPLYRNMLTTADEWRNPPRFRAAIETARNRPLSEAEYWDFHRTQHRLHTEMETRWHPGLDAIDDLVRPIIPASLASRPHHELAPDSPRRGPNQQRPQKNIDPNTLNTSTRQRRPGDGGHDRPPVGHERTRE